MIAKTFEIRDEGTFIPVLAIKLEPVTEQDRFLLSRAGYGPNKDSQSKYVQLAQINGGEGKSNCDPYGWGGSRTYKVAHNYIIEHFDELESGMVVDVEFITGITSSPKVSEALV